MKLIVSATVETPHGDKMVPLTVDLGDADQQPHSPLRGVRDHRAAAQSNRTASTGCAPPRSSSNREPMPVLTNAKHELFAQEIAKGATATDAYERAGYKRNDGNASKLANTKDVKARVKEITGKAAAEAHVTLDPRARRKWRRLPSIRSSRVHRCRGRPPTRIQAR
jgi:hypothetical protein